MFYKKDQLEDALLLYWQIRAQVGCAWQQSHMHQPVLAVLADKDADLMYCCCIGDKDTDNIEMDRDRKGR